MKRYSLHKGLTLVELMIALTIGLFIIAGVAQIYMSGRAAANLQERMSNLQENGRFAQMFLQRSLQKAGYKNFSLGAAGIDTSVVSGRCGAPVQGVNGSGVSSDQITVCYQAVSGVTSDCLGTTANASSGVVTDLFSINRDTTTGVSRLMCAGSLNGSTQPLVDGIEAMHILYGVDNDGDGFANQYVNASAVTNWTQVVSVRVAVLASTNSNDANSSGIIYGDTASGAITYTLLDQTLPSSAVSLAVGARARVFTTTVQLRNQAVQ